MTKQATIRSEWERFRDEVLDGDIPEGKPSEMAHPKLVGAWARARKLFDELRLR